MLNNTYLDARNCCITQADEKSYCDFNNMAHSQDKSPKFVRLTNCRRSRGMKPAFQLNSRPTKCLLQP